MNMHTFRNERLAETRHKYLCSCPEGIMEQNWSHERHSSWQFEHTHIRNYCGGINLRFK